MKQITLNHSNTLQLCVSQKYIVSSPLPCCGQASATACSRLEPNANLVSLGGELGAEFCASCRDVGECLRLLVEPAEIGLVAIVVAHELECCTIESAAAADDANQHADPVAMGQSAMAGVEREIAHAVEDRLALVDLDRQ